MKHVLSIFGLLAAPFITIWIVFLLSGFAFNPITTVFQSGGFYVFSFIWWMISTIGYLAYQEEKR